MAWNAPMTFVANTPLTADMLNQQLRDNLKETLPGKATRSGSYFVVNNTNSVRERYRSGQTLVTACTVTGTSYTDPSTGSVGPSVTVETGTCASVWIRAETWATDVRVSTRMGVAVTGASRVNASDSACLALYASLGNRIQGSHMVMFDNLTPGMNTFTAKYRVSSGGGTGNWRFRQISVFPY